MVVRIGQRSARRRRTFFREWREARGLTQEQLAERLGTNKSAVSKVENGKTLYNQSGLEAWADVLECEPADLISRPPPGVDNDEASGSDLLAIAMTEIRRIVEEVLKATRK